MRNTLLGLTLIVGIPALAKDVMLMNRIGPSVSELYIASADGRDEHKLLATPGFDYHATYSNDGKWIVFTSERAGYGQADIYGVRVNGTQLERLIDDPSSTIRPHSHLTTPESPSSPLAAAQGEHASGCPGGLPPSGRPSTAQSAGRIHNSVV